MDWIVLAQPKKPPIELWITCAILIGMIVLLGAVVLFYRRKVLADSDSTGKAEAWNLDDLHRLRTQGEITEAEYQAMRAAIIGHFTGERRGDSGTKFPELPPGTLMSGGEESDDGQVWDWVAEGFEDEGKSRKTDT